MFAIKWLGFGRHFWGDIQKKFYILTKRGIVLFFRVRPMSGKSELKILYEFHQICLWKNFVLTE